MYKIINKIKLTFYVVLIFIFNINIEKTKAVEITVVNSTPSVNFVDEIISYILWFSSLFILIYILLILLKLAQYIKSNNKKRKIVTRKKLILHFKIIVFFIVIRYFLIPLLLMNLLH